jgi:citrate lyase subunit beta / citryl-CoA lyase
MIHPASVLTDSRRPIVLPAVDHYAGNEKLMLKALGMQAEAGRALGRATFDVTLDCEDGAASGRELQHAQMVAAIATSPANLFGRVGVRIHDAAHPACLQDIRTILPLAGHRLAYITLPKVEALQDIEKVVCAIDDAMPNASRPLRLHCLIESQSALQLVDSIAAHPRVESLAFGVMDFVSDFAGMLPEGAMKSPLQFDHPLMRHALCMLTLAAHRHGKCAAASVTVDLTNPKQAFEDALRGWQEFGFTRKWSIHPSQIEPILAAYRPDQAQVSRACDLLIAAQDADWAPIRFDDELHDKASYRYFWQLVQRAQRAGVALTASAQLRFFSDSVSSKA